MCNWKSVYLKTKLSHHVNAENIYLSLTKTYLCKCTCINVYLLREVQCITSFVKSRIHCFNVANVNLNYKFKISSLNDGTHKIVTKGIM